MHAHVPATTVAELVKVARFEGGVATPPGQSLRKLAKVAGISAAQLSRIESGQVDRPGQEILVAIARALNRNPLPLLVVAGHITNSEARTALGTLLRTGGELEDAWGPWTNLSLHEARRLVRDPDADAAKIRELASDIFRVQETDESLWNDADAAAYARGQTSTDLRELIEIWRYIHDAELRNRLVNFARCLRDISDANYLAEVAEDEAAGELNQLRTND